MKHEPQFFYLQNGENNVFFSKLRRSEEIGSRKTQGITKELIIGLKVNS